MSSGETLLLLPAQRSLDLLPLRLPMGSPRRCLFGRPEPSRNTIAEEWEVHRQRIISRWDFDIATEKPVVPPRRYAWEKVVSRPKCEGGSLAGAAASTAGKERCESLRRRERVTPYRQLRITDFWRNRKLEGLNNKLEAKREEEESGVIAIDHE